MILFLHLVASEVKSHDNQVIFRYGIPTSSDAMDECVPNLNLNLESIKSSTKSLISYTTTAARKIVQIIPSSLHQAKIRNSLYERFDMMKAKPAVIRKRQELTTLTKTTDTSSVSILKHILTEPLTRELSQSGVYFGLSPKTIVESYGSSSDNGGTRKKRVDLRDSMSEALEELRIMRQELEALRKEMHTLQQQLIKQDDGSIIDDDDVGNQRQLKAQRKKKLKEYAKINKEVEEWAKRLLSDQLEIENKKASKFQIQGNDSIEWTEIHCAKLLEPKLNPDRKTYAYLTYMKDSRDSKSKAATAASPNNNKNWSPDEEYPCIKMHSTLDAPIEEVCIYLSQEKHVWDYNSMIQDHSDVEVISSNSKICWAQTPQILFLKPKDFVTYCSHRWLPDGTQILINQATDHSSKVANAYAFRGATIIRRDPDNPSKQTQIYMLAHASPGSDIPGWAMKTAIKSLVPIEPFRLFYRMNQGILQSKNELTKEWKRLRDKQDATNGNDNNEAIEMVTNTLNEAGSEKVLVKNWLPAGVAQMGFACFWPDGGGPIEGSSRSDASTAATNYATDQMTAPTPVTENVDERLPAQSQMSESTISSFPNEIYPSKNIEHRKRVVNRQVPAA